MKTFNYILGAAAALLLASCSQDDIASDGQGKVALNATVSTDVDVVSRITDEESAALAENAVIWISNSKGLVRQYSGMAQVPASIDLLTGSYIAEVWAGDSVSASFDARCFYGRQEFDINPGQTTQVDLVCPIANVVASVDYTQAEGIEDVLKDIKMTVGHKRGSLVFAGKDTRKGYFMMPASDPNLTYTFSGTQLDGTEFTYSGTIENAKKATEYQFVIKYKPVSSNVGGATFTITIDRNEISLEDKRELIVAPKFSGYGFDLNQTVSGEQGTIGRRTVYVSSAIAISELILESDDLTAFPILKGKDVDLVGMSDDAKAELAAGGINVKVQPGTNEDGSANSLIQVNFEDSYTNSLTDGEHIYRFTAKDAGARTSTATLTINISDAPAMTQPVVESELTYHSAILRGIITKDGVEKAGFNYRKAGTGEWTYVEGVAATRAFGANTVITATVEGLDAVSKYEYTVVADEFESAPTTFTTPNGTQLPNAGFEQWTGSKPMWISGFAGTDFWDSGNHGSKTAGKDITTNDASVKHSGNYSAKLCTASMFGVIAAGNMFTGRFCGTENVTKGILGWGRPFTDTPKALKFWVKYIPQAYGKDFNDQGVKKGDMDKGIVYIALLDDSKVSYQGESWPVMVRTADLTNYSFKKDAANVIAYGEHVFEGATQGDGMIEVTIPIEYVRQGVTPSNILIVCSASIYGDYYCGAANSTMWVDDMELVY